MKLYSNGKWNLKELENYLSNFTATVRVTDIDGKKMKLVTASINLDLQEN